MVHRQSIFASKVPLGFRPPSSVGSHSHFLKVSLILNTLLAYWYAHCKIELFNSTNDLSAFIQKVSKQGFGSGSA